jgi:hypothetical protein
MAVIDEYHVYHVSLDHIAEDTLLTASDIQIPHEQAYQHVFHHSAIPSHAQSRRRRTHHYLDRCGRRADGEFCGYLGPMLSVE